MMIYTTTMVIVVVTALASMLLYYHYIHVWSEFKIRAESLVAGFAHDLDLPVMLEDRDTIHKMVKGALEIKDVISINVFNKEGRLLSSHGNKFSIPEELQYAVQQPIDIRMGEFMTGLIEKGRKGGVEKLGNVEIIFSTARINNDLMNMIYFVIVFTVIILILRITSDYIFANGITSPLAKLMKVSETVADGDLSQHIEISSAREIGKLATSFNKMIVALKERDEEIKFQHRQLQRNYEKLEDSHIELDKAYNELGSTARELEEYKEELEEKVEERTKELNEAHLKLQDSYKKLKEVDKLKSEFLASMSHELRTPLNSIIGFSKVILKGIDGPVTDLQKVDLNAIHQGGQHLLALINDILDLSKIESGKLELLREMINIGEIAEEVVSASHSLIGEKPVKITMDVEENLPLVYADKIRIKQVLLNMMSNALKFTYKGDVNLKVKKIGWREMKSIEDNPYSYCPGRAAVREGDFILTSVRDTGIGIKKDDMPMVFEEFRQIDASSTRKEGGTGLGMAISHKFIEMHGGELWVESQPGIGSIFHFIVPLGRSVEGKVFKSDKAAVDSADGGKMVVVVIDDEMDSITLMKRTLEREGYEVVAIQDPDDIVNKVTEIKPNAIILDVIIPKKDGWQIIRELKSNPETKYIPVIFCSIIANKKLGFSLGASDYLIKPVSDDDLLMTLRVLNGNVKDIMVIDDNPKDAELIERFLRGHGYAVSLAYNGKEGIYNLKRYKPELIIIDLMMPEVDGFAVIEEVKKDITTRDIPIIVVSAKDITADDKKRLNGNVEAFISKGFLNEDELMRQVVKALGKIRDKK